MATRLGVLVEIVGPVDLFGALGRLDVEIHHYRLLSAANNHALERLRITGVDFLVRNEGRHVDEITWISFRHELEAIAPAHPSFALQDVNDAFHVPVVVRSGLRFGVDGDGACPELLRADPGVGNRRGARHPRSLRCIGVELSGPHHPDAIQPPT